MDNIIGQVKYNRINCAGCGDTTSADLTAFDFGKAFRLILKEDEKWNVLGYIDLKFYYTLRDLCQELNYVVHRGAKSNLKLTVRNVIRQIEFLMDEMSFDQIADQIKNTSVNSYFYKKITSYYSSPDETMRKLEELILALKMTEDKDEVILQVPIQIEFAKDDNHNELPIEIQAWVEEKAHPWKLTRVCPMCGTQMDRQAGYRNEFVIGMAGLSGAGKTAYLASLIYQLRKLGENDYIHIKAEKNDSLETFERMFVQPYQSGSPLMKTDLSTPEKIPQMYLPLVIGNKECNLIFIDMPGEIYSGNVQEGLDFVENERIMMKKVDMIWCCIEPSMIDSKYQRAAITENNAVQQLGNLSHILDLLYTKKPPASIILTKCDLLKNETVLFQPQAKVMEEYLLEEHYLDLQKTKNHMEKTREFVDRMNNFRLTMESNFNGMSMFGVASYGTKSADVDETTGAQKVFPSMIELPFLWTLARLNLLKPANEVISGKKKVILEEVRDIEELNIRG